MSGFEDRLSLDVSEALAAIARVDDAVAQIGTTLQSALDQAVASFEIPDTTVDLTANVDDVGPAIDEAVAGADTDIAVEADATDVTATIDDAVSAADSVVEVEADTTEAQAALEELAASAPVIEPEVDTSSIDAASDSLGGFTESSNAAGASATATAGSMAGVGAASRLMTGDLSALEGTVSAAGGTFARVATGVGGLALGFGVLFKAGLESQAAQERYNLILGDFADEVDRVDVGGLNTDLTRLAIVLGDDDEALQNAAATMFNLGVNSGVAAPQVAQTTKEILALAARAVALNPALGEVGDVAQRMFTGLARGGRFAANFGISLSTAEINARAFSNTGKTLASDLTLFEKSMAGAQITVEKLGDGLANDINAGADNVAFRLRALRGQFNETLDTLGTPLVDPVVDGLTALEPTLESAAQVFGSLAAAVIPVVAALAEGLAPVFEALAPTAEAVAEAVKLLADGLGLIPAPALGAAAAIGGVVAITRTLNTLTALGPAGAGGRVAALAQRFPLLTRAMVPAALGLAAVTGVMELFNRRMAQGDEVVNDFIANVKSGFEDTSTIEEAQAQVDAMRVSVEDLSESADRAGGGPLGIFRQKGEVRDLRNGASALNDLGNEAQTVINTARELQREFGLTSARALELARAGQPVIDAFRAQHAALSDTTEAVGGYDAALEVALQRARAGIATQEDLITVVNFLGADIEEVAKGFEEAAGPAQDFANAIIESFPGAQAAIDSFAEDATVTLQGFQDELVRQALETAQFVGNLGALVDRGATELARQFSELGQEEGAPLAAQAVALSDEALATAEETQRRINTVNAQNAIDATKIAADLHGGLEAVFAETQALIGERLEKIPGQLSDGSEGAGFEIATGVRAGVELGFQEQDFGEVVSRFMMEPLASSIDEGTIAAVEAARRAADAVLGAFTDVFEIGSPSKVMVAIGEDVAAGLFIGLADLEGAADVVDPVLDAMKQFGLTAADVARATGESVDEIVASLESIGEAEKELTADELKQIGDFVKGVGGSKGVKDLQAALAQQTAAAFKGMDTDEIKAVVERLNTRAALTRVQPTFGVTPVAPEPFATNVVKGADAAAPNPAIGELNVTVTPPPEATADEQALLVARATGWVLQGIRTS